MPFDATTEATTRDSRGLLLQSSKDYPIAYGGQAVVRPMPLFVQIFSSDCGAVAGGSNVQMGIDPEDGEMMIIEMNPRVSRSSALASKATGFPIAKIAAKLAVGLTLDQIPNDITLKTPASFEPSIDYIVTKVTKLTLQCSYMPNQNMDLVT